MTLLELSTTYLDSAKIIRLRIQELTKAVQKQEAQMPPEDPELLFSLRQRILKLTPLLRETQELAVLTANYYDRRYHKNEKYTL